MFTILALQQHISVAPGLANRNRPRCLDLAGGYTAAALRNYGHRRFTGTLP